METPAPISRFQAGSGIESFVQGIIRHNGRLYATTGRGVSYLDETAGPSPLFRRVASISTLAWSLLRVGQRLLVGTQDAVFEITGTTAKKINDLHAITLHVSKQDSNLVFAGLLEGLAVLRWVDGGWQNLGRVPGIRERIIAITEDESGYLWLGTQTEGILKISIPKIHLPEGTHRQTGNMNEILAGVRLTRFGKQHGLPGGPVSYWRPSRFQNPKGITAIRCRSTKVCSGFNFWNDVHGHLVPDK